ncbi:hypothetical protein ACLNGM_17475 [Aureimonas phyllosphaerae]|uniref:hypothetical protein n=1 Tax=Aureimonas phyllosphaerae TaxID=1166078 RepID=UPI003A5BD4A2
MPTSAEWEDWCLETFFLNAAVDGKIEAIEINDERIVDFSNSLDIAGAHREFLSVLPSTIDGYLKGEISPSFKTVGKASARSLGGSEARPNFVRILLFFLWLQITASKDEDEGDIRRMASKALQRQSPQVLVGLHHMWVALSKWLRDHRDIVLVLPDHGNENHVGITKRLAFPTKRDLDLLRRVRDDGYSRTDLRSVTRRIAGDNSFDRTSPAFRRAFAAWQSTAVIDEEAARELPFMGAWVRVLAEKDIGTTIVLSCDEFGSIEALKCLADGRVRTLQTDRDFVSECRKLGSKIAKSTINGLLPLRKTGLASWIVTDSGGGDDYLVSHAAFENFTPAAQSTIHARGEVRYLPWRLCTIEFGTRKKVAAPQQVTSLRFIDKVRVGARGTYLGRWPMTPRVAFPGSERPILEIAGQPLDADHLGDGTASFPEGIWNGVARARTGRQSTEITLRSDAYPHADQDIRFIDRARHVPEDGVLHDTQPHDPDDLPIGMFETGVEPDPRLIALQEALYARSARTIPLQAAVDMASRVATMPGTPDVWGLVRLFVDSGWFDVPSLSQVPARILVQRRPSFRWRSKNDLYGMTIEGPLPIRLEDSIRRKAEALGLVLERNLGRTAWSLPKLWIGSREKEAVHAFIDSSDLGELQIAEARNRSIEWAAIEVGAEFERTGTWDSVEIRFGGNYATERWPRLSRMDRADRDTHARFLIEHENGLRETFVSANLALLRYLDLQDSPAFVASGDEIRAVHPRFRLPSSWARWLSVVHLRNCALQENDEGWSCSYPATFRSASILAEIYPALHMIPSHSATESGMLPWMERTRIRFAKDRRPIWLDGKLRATYDLGGLRTCLREHRDTS